MQPPAGGRLNKYAERPGSERSERRTAWAIARDLFAQLRARTVRAVNALNRLFEQAGDSARIKSQAMSPLLWLAGICIPSGVALALKGEPDAIKVLGCLLVVYGVGFPSWWYTYWAKHEPNRLGSEAFFTRQDILRVVEKGGSERVAELADYVMKPAALPEHREKLDEPL